MIVKKILNYTANIKPKRKSRFVLGCDTCSVVWYRDSVVFKNIHYTIVYMSKHNSETPWNLQGQLQAIPRDFICVDAI